MKNRIYVVACHSCEGWFNAITTGPYDAFTPKGFDQLNRAICEECGEAATIINIIELKDDKPEEGGGDIDLSKVCSGGIEHVVIGNQRFDWCAETSRYVEVEGGE